MLGNYQKQLTVTGLLVVALLASPGTIADEDKERSEQQLLHLLKQDCGSCHGMTLKGGLGPSLLPEDLQNKPEWFLTQTIMAGRPGTAMPPWNAILTKREAGWIAKQLKQGVK